MSATEIEYRVAGTIELNRGGPPQFATGSSHAEYVAWQRRVEAVAGPIARSTVVPTGSASKIGGYAALFDVPAEIGGLFVEKIAKGAFSTAIIKNDVRALFNHDPNLILARTSAGTLSLREDAKGLAFEATLPDAVWTNDLLASIRRCDISQMSFAFIARREAWDDSGDMPIRTLIEVELMDVSPVTFASYEQTQVTILPPVMRTLAAGNRAMQEAMQARLDRMHRQLASREVSRLLH